MVGTAAGRSVIDSEQPLKHGHEGVNYLGYFKCKRATKLFCFVVVFFVKIVFYTLFISIFIWTELVWCDIVSREPNFLHIVTSAFLAYAYVSWRQLLFVKTPNLLYVIHQVSVMCWGCVHETKMIDNSVNSLQENKENRISTNELLAMQLL